MFETSTFYLNYPLQKDNLCRIITKIDHFLSAILISVTESQDAHIHEAG